MYNDQLEQKTIPIDDLFLDPNNPRFWSEQTQRAGDVPDSKIPDQTHQTKARTRMAEQGVEELKNSILRNGFLPLDRIVVRQLDGLSGKYVVIEGNRRLAALKTLREQIDLGTISETGLDEEYLQSLKTSTEKVSVLVYKGADKKDIAWILQGIRHIGGIRNWMPAQQGKLVADQIDKEGLTFSQASQRFGLTTQAVGKRYRSYKALQQMREDDEFQGKADNKYYSLFEEAVRDKNVKVWLGWNDDERRFKNTDNLKQFYSWICPDEERENKERRIHDPRHISALGNLLAAKQEKLLNRIDKHELEIEAANQKLTDANDHFDWKGSFEKITNLIGDIPNAAIDSNAAEMLVALDALNVQLANLRKKAEAIAAKSVADNSTKI